MSQCKNSETSLISDAYQEFIGNGFYLAKLEHNGENYRLGATTPQFRNELTNVSLTPNPEELLALQDKGLYLQVAAQAPRVAITCGGVGSIWPGLGRQLYDTFPAARAAMDSIAAIAKWDVLALMDETDLEKLSCSRWQLPYLFFIEYAQASYLQSLGFSADIVTGHSLGEPISLSLAGVFDLETAWQVFDRRAVYIDELEQDTTRNMGMMAVYAPLESIQKLLETFPDLHICNQNTPTQYIVGGKKDVLKEAKRTLRKEKCPAIILPINMAFHHPHLRVLRQSAIDGLMGLTINPPRIPVISNVTADVYPSQKEGICKYIADLDENTVRWVDCVHSMWNKYSIRHFVELGSADNICNLIKDIEPQALCIAVTQKNNEVASMRKAVAHLYALGHIPLSGLHTMPGHAETQTECQAEWQVHDEHVHEDSDVKPVKNEYIAPHVKDILPIIATAAGLEEHSLHAHMDLRHELAISSNSFPAMLYSFEDEFGISVQFEDVMHVATILDLANVVAKLRDRAMEVTATPQALSATSQAPCATSQQHILELCYGHALTQSIYRNEHVPLPALALGTCQGDVSGTASLHNIQKAHEVQDLWKDNAHDYASLVLCLPTNAQLRPWNYPQFCAQLASVSEGFLQKSTAARKKIYFQATEHFSSFTESEADMQPPLLSSARLLQSLQDTARTIFPHAYIYGFDNINFTWESYQGEHGEGVGGVTREAIIHMQASMDSALSCQSVLSLRQITANGRRTNVYSPMARAQILMRTAAENTLLVKVLEQSQANLQQKIDHASWKTFAKQYNLLHNQLSAYSESYVSSYACAICIELLANMLIDTLNQEQRYVLQSIGKVRFSEQLYRVFDESHVESCHFSWNKTDGQGFDGQLTDASGTILLTINDARFKQMDL